MRKANSTSRAFTLTELIIVVAVIGILAAIIIPGLLNTGDRSKEKSDQNTVAALNSTLDSGHAVRIKLDTIIDVRNYLMSKGYSREAFIPEYPGVNVNDKFCFVWDKSEMAILMFNLFTNEVVFPKEYTVLQNDTADDWYFLEKPEYIGSSPSEDSSDFVFPSAIATATQYFNNKLTASNPGERLDDSKSYIFAAKVSVSYEYDGTTYPIVENESERVQTVYAVYNGEMVGTSTLPLGPFTIVQKMQNLRYSTTQTSTEAWIVKYQLIGAADYVQIEGLYADPYVQETADGNTYRTFTKITGVSTSGDPNEQNWW